MQDQINGLIAQANQVQIPASQVRTGKTKPEERNAKAQGPPPRKPIEDPVPNPIGAAKPAPAVAQPKPVPPKEAVPELEGDSWATPGGFPHSTVWEKVPLSSSPFQDSIRKFPLDLHSIFARIPSSGFLEVE